MQYRQLAVDLCPNVNFIRDQFGSNKSAILTAIQLCLGASAKQVRRTHPGIKTRCEVVGNNARTTRLEVTFCNEGGFQPEIYGKTITVRRNIEAAGGSRYKLLDENGKARFGSKRDLDAMLNQFNIDLESPIIAFSHAYDQSNFQHCMYNLFCKATERLKPTYAGRVGSIAELKADHKLLERKVAICAEGVQKLKDVAESFPALDALQKDLDANLRHQAWAAHTKVSLNAALSNEKLQLARYQREKCRMEYAKWGQRGSNAQEKSLKESHIKTLSLRANASADLKHALEKQLELADAKLKELGHDCVELEHKRLAAEQGLKATELALQRVLEDNRQEEIVFQRACMLKLQEKKDEVIKLLQEEKALREKEANQHTIIHFLEQQVEDAKQHAQTKERQVNDARQQIEQLQASHGNIASSFGSINDAKLGNEVKKVNQQGGWKVPLLGAVGSYMKSTMQQMTGANAMAAVEVAKQELTELQHHYSEHKLNKQKHEKILDKAKQISTTIVEGQSKAKDTIDQLLTQITDLQREIEKLSDVAATDTAELEADVTTSEQNLVMLNKKVEGIEKQKQDLRVSTDKWTKQLEDVTARHQRVMSELNVSKLDLSQFLDEADAQQTQKEAALSRYERQKASVSALEFNLQNQQTDVKVAMQEARLLQYRHDYEEKTSERGENGIAMELLPVDPGDEELESVKIQEPLKTMEYYALTLERLRQRIEKEKDARNIASTTRKEAIMEYKRAKNDLQSNTAMLATTRVSIEKLTHDEKDRSKKRWEKSRDHMECITTRRFRKFLQLKGSCGDLVFDHEARTLHICYQKDINVNSQTYDFNAISDGEHRYVALSLFLAIGQLSESSFHIIDEAETSMDFTTSKIVLEALAKMAEDHRQFIIITPQDVSSVRPDPKVRIHSLKQPVETSAVVGSLPQQGH